MAELLYQGHASFRLRAWDGTTVYLDPYAGRAMTCRRTGCW